MTRTMNSEGQYGEHVKLLRGGFLQFNYFEPRVPAFDINSYIKAKRKHFFFKNLEMGEIVVNVNAITLAKEHKIFEKKYNEAFLITEVFVDRLGSFFSPCSLEEIISAIEASFEANKIFMN